MNRLSIIHSVMNLSAKRISCKWYVAMALFAKCVFIRGKAKATAYSANGATQESCLSRDEEYTKGFDVQASSEVHTTSAFIQGLGAYDHKLNKTCQRGWRLNHENSNSCGNYIMGVKAGSTSSTIMDKLATQTAWGFSIQASEGPRKFLLHRPGRVMPYPK